MEEEQKFTITDCCAWLRMQGFKDATPGIVRYMEGQLGIEVERDKKLNRKYSIEDMEKLKFIFQLKAKGLSYEGIKNVLNQQEAVVEEAVQETRNDVVLQQQNMQELIAILTQQIKDAVKAEMAVTITSEMETMQNTVEALNTKVSDLQKQLEAKEQEHYNKLDAKLRQIQEQTARKKGFLGLFGK